MLRFTELPPQAGNIEFDFDKVNFQDLAEATNPEGAYRQLGQEVGAILLEKLEPPTPTHVFRAALRLVDDNFAYYLEPQSDGTRVDGQFLHGVIDVMAEKVGEA